MVLYDCLCSYGRAQVWTFYLKLFFSRVCSSKIKWCVKQCDCGACYILTTYMSIQLKATLCRNCNFVLFSNQTVSDCRTSVINTNSVFLYQHCQLQCTCRIKRKLSGIKTMLFSENLCLEVEVKVCPSFGRNSEQQHARFTPQIQRQFTQHKFSHQMKHFCCGLSFLWHDNGVLAPLKPQMFETGFQSGIFWKRKLLSSFVNWQEECV